MIIYFFYIGIHFNTIYLLQYDLNANAETLLRQHVKVEERCKLEVTLCLSGVQKVMEVRWSPQRTVGDMVNKLLLENKFTCSQYECYSGDNNEVLSNLLALGDLECQKIIVRDIAGQSQRRRVGSKRSTNIFGSARSRASGRSSFNNKK